MGSNCVARPCVGVVADRRTLGDVRNTGCVECAFVEATSETVVRRRAVLEPAQSHVGKGPGLDTVAITGAVAAEVFVGPQLGFQHLANVCCLVPVTIRRMISSQKEKRDR